MRVNLDETVPCDKWYKERKRSHEEKEQVVFEAIQPSNNNNNNHINNTTALTYITILCVYA